MPIYNVEQDHLAFSTTALVEKYGTYTAKLRLKIRLSVIIDPGGELASMFASTCIVVVVIFDDQSVLMEHRSHLDLGQTGDVDEAINLLNNIAQHILDFKEKETKLQ
jgi:hypothetical protein